MWDGDLVVAAAGSAARRGGRATPALQRAQNDASDAEVAKTHHSVLRTSLFLLTKYSGYMTPQREQMMMTMRLSTLAVRALSSAGAWLMLPTRREHDRIPGSAATERLRL